MTTSNQCQNCDDQCRASVYCEGCEEIICPDCWEEHNGDAPDHTETDDE